MNKCKKTTKKRLIDTENKLVVSIGGMNRIDEGD